MPTLTNPRQERYAQLRMEGNSQVEAYELAGYEPNDSNASRLETDELVRARIDELLAESAQESKITKEHKRQVLWEIVERNNKHARSTTADGSATGHRLSGDRVAIAAVAELNRMDGDHAAAQPADDGESVTRITFGPFEGIGFE